VKLLIDANLSPKVAAGVDDLFPGSVHVFSVRLGPDDQAIWEYARDHGYMIVSKDSDFYRFSVVHGAPPKVAWLKVGNAGTRKIVALLRARYSVLEALDADTTAAMAIVDGI
jgi:predicted nuclease of predicted toxin-antitoxin system